MAIEKLVSQFEMDVIQVISREHRSNPVRGERFSVNGDTMHLKKVALSQERFHCRRGPSLVGVLGGEAVREVEDLASDPILVGQWIEGFNNFRCVEPGVGDPWQLTL